MRQIALSNITKGIIQNNIYLTLSTSDGKKPWSTPLFYCTDKKYNFYFISQPDTLHAQHIKKNPNVSFAIFDSNQKEGTGNGIQATGKAYMLTGNEIIEGLKYYSTTFIELSAKNLTTPALYRLYRIKTEKFYIQDPEADIDKRIEVDINL